MIHDLNIRPAKCGNSVVKFSILQYSDSRSSGKGRHSNESTASKELRTASLFLHGRIVITTLTTMSYERIVIHQLRVNHE